MAKHYDILESADVIEALSDSEAGMLLKALCRIKQGHSLPEVPRAVKVALALELNKLNAALDHRRQISDKRRDSVNKRWENTNEYKCIQMNTNVSGCIIQPPLSTPINNTPSSPPKGGNDAPKGADAKKRKVFSVPSVEEIGEYCSEKGFSFNPEDFFDFYQSKNWMVGKVKMSDWRAAARRWEKSQILQQQQQQRYSPPVQERMKL